ncbi:hypothetical protein ES703_84086 [subsurface metagenome]
MFKAFPGSSEPLYFIMYIPISEAISPTPQKTTGATINTEVPIVVKSTSPKGALIIPATPKAAASIIAATMDAT